MAAQRSYEILKERRAERMRLGKAVCEMVEFASDPEIRVALVPLTDAEYQNSLVVAAQANVTEISSTHEVFYRDRIQKCSILLSSAREPDNLTKPFFETLGEVVELDFNDISHLFSYYEQMMEFSSPSLDGISVDDMDEIKKALLEVDWNDLSGRSWYAAKRFLSTLTPTQPQVNLFGSLPTSSLITKSDEEKSTDTAL
jgi:hypothetical protein